MYRMYHIDERQRCIQSACSLASFITGSCSVPTASASTVMLWLFDVGYTAIGRSSEDMLINLDVTQLLCMPMYCSDADGDLSKWIDRVNTSCYIRYMTTYDDTHALFRVICALAWKNFILFIYRYCL